MRSVKPVLAFLCLSLLSGCGGGGGSTTGTGGTNGTGSNSGGSGSVGSGAVSVSTPVISPTFVQSNSGPGVQTGAGATSGTGAADPANGVVASVDLSPGVASLEVNRRITLSAIGKDSAGTPVVVPPENWQWTSSDPNVAVLTSSGATATISGVNAGSVVITVREGSSNVTAKVTLTVTAAGTSSGSAPGGSGLGDGSGSGSGNGSGSGSGSGGSGGASGGLTVYGNDFANGTGSEWSNRHVDTTPGTAQHPATPFLGQFGAETVKLSLKDLAVHTTATIEFDLFVIRSMDGSASVSGVGPDIWDLSVAGGPTLLHTTFSNITSGLASNRPGFSQGFFQAFPDNYPGGEHPFQTGAAEANTLGFVFQSGIIDAVYHLKYTFPHTATSIVFNFASSQTQATTDESWGLKNVKLTLNP